ncbi:MAG: Mor transcription activator family protein [Pseudomonadota bacterium]
MITEYDIKIDDLPDDLADIARIIGLDAVLKLVDARGGESIYIHKADRVAREARDRKICKEFDGRNYSDLAQTYKLSTSQIRVILNDSRKKSRCGKREWQLELPFD